MKKSKKPDAQDVLIVTGYSGAGISSVLKCLEDLGYEVFDNFPLPLVEPLMQIVKKRTGPVAIGIDTRTRGFGADKILAACQAAKARLLFITCDDSVLQQRFTETRRRHPMAINKPVRSGIAQEKKLLQAVREKADIAIDTTDLTVHDLRHILEGHFGRQKNSRLTINLVSFGFRNGLPREADIVMDVRFLKNPHWKKEMREKTGLDRKVQDFIKKDLQYTLFLENFTNLLRILLPKYKEEGKNYLTIGIGCTGGRHRSVFVVQSLKAWLKAEGYDAFVEHRDL